MKQRTVLVTGASGGIGAAVALELQKEGYRVYATARDSAGVERLGISGVVGLKMDVTDEDSMVTAIQKIEKAAGMIDVLINNAGYGSFGSLEDVPMVEARRQVEVNLFGLARMTQLVIPKMREAHAGTIVNISSIGGKFGEAYGSWYHATKYAVEGLGDSLALELAPFGIKVITIEPGLIKTKWSSTAAENLLKVSANSVYAAQASKKAASMKKFNEMRLASDPEVVAKGVAKILKKRHPKLRYAIGGGARPILFLRKILSDRIFYYLLRTQL